MNGSDQKKLLEAGYVIVRPDDTPSPRIKYKDKDHREWVTLHTGFNSKAERDRKLAELLKVSTIIQD